MNFNRVILAGNLTRDPELQHTQGGTVIAKIGLAVNRRWKSPGGEQKEEVTFVDATAFGKTAEVIAQYFAKGKPILIEGRLRLEEWEDKQGQKRSKLGVIVESFQFVGGKSEWAAPAMSQAPGGAGRNGLPQVGGGFPPDDNIPFHHGYER